MDGAIRCLGLSESTLKRCKRIVSKSRRKKGHVTCVQHHELDDIAKRYSGEADDDLRVVEHILREEGLIPATVVSKPSFEQEQKQVVAQGTKGDVSTLSVKELRRLAPQQFNMRTKWKAFEDGLKVKDFEEGQAPKEGKGSHRAAVFGALAKNAKEFGFLLAPAAALVSAVCLALYYFFLGFGFQSVVVDPTSVTATAFLAIFSILTVFFSGDKTIKEKDRNRKRLYGDRYKKVIEFDKRLSNMSAGSERISNSIDVCILGKAKQESASVTANCLSQLQRKKNVEGRFWNRLAKFFSKPFFHKPNISTSAAKPQGLDLSKATACELVTLEDAPIGDRIKELQSRHAIYSVAEKDVESQQEAARIESEIESLNKSIAEYNAELERLGTQSLWVLLTFSWRPYIFTGLVLGAALAGVVIVTHLAVIGAVKYCDQWIRPINCFYLELAQPGGSSEVTTFHERAFVHGRVSDHFLVSSLGAEDEPATREGIARLTIPVSSVVGMQRYGREYTRMGQSDPIVPVVHLNQENAFLINHNTALASGGGGGNKTTTVNYDAKFPVDNREFTQLTLNNEFQTDVLIRQETFPTLVSNFILDGKKMQEPGDGELRHILVPFFLDPVKSDGSKRRKIYAVNEDPSIDTELDAFMAGFFSLSDPEFALEDPTSNELASPTNLLGMVRTALGACKPQSKANATFEIDILGYSSEMPFKESSGEGSPTSDALNHALAEGRRFAVLVNVVDYDGSFVGEKRAKVVPKPRDGNTVQAEFSDPILTFATLLKRDNTADLVAFLESVDPVVLLTKLKSEVFRFNDKDEMNNHLDEWVPSVDHADGPVREVFQRSAVISISEDEIKKCGL